MSTPPFPPDHLQRLQSLTRDYARLSQNGAGLGKVLGGWFVCLLVGVDLVGHWGHLTWVGAVAPLPGAAVLPLGLLPFLWLGARVGLARWWYQRHGAVAPVAAPLSRSRALRMRILRWVLPVFLLLGLVPIFTANLPWQGRRAAVVVALAAGVILAWPRFMGPNRLERMMGVCLFIGAAILVSGIQMAVEDTLLAFPLIGLAAIVMGLREHLAFLRLERDLAGGR